MRASRVTPPASTALPRPSVKKSLLARANKNKNPRNPRPSHKARKANPVTWRLPNLPNPRHALCANSAARRIFSRGYDTRVCDARGRDARFDASHARRRRRRVAPRRERGGRATRRVLARRSIAAREDARRNARRANAIARVVSFRRRRRDATARRRDDAPERDADSRATDSETERRVATRSSAPIVARGAEARLWIIRRRALGTRRRRETTRCGRGRWRRDRNEATRTMRTMGKRRARGGGKTG